VILTAGHDDRRTLVSWYAVRDGCVVAPDAVSETPRDIAGLPPDHSVQNERRAIILSNQFPDARGGVCTSLLRSIAVDPSHRSTARALDRRKLANGVWAGTVIALLCACMVVTAEVWYKHTAP